MSKIKDLYAEVNGIDDLAPTKYDKTFYLAVKQLDFERAVGQILDKAKKFPALDWLWARAEFSVDYNDYGVEELYFENFTNLCETAATDLVDAYIEDQHFDMSDDEYSKMIDTVSDNLADMWADIEQDIIDRRKENDKEEWAQHTSFYNKDNLGV